MAVFHGFEGIAANNLVYRRILGGWDSNLNSSSGLFVRVKLPDDKLRSLGPHIVSRGENIQGDMFFMERNIFEAKATPDQKMFFEHLQSFDPVKAKQYVLHVLSITGVWADDISQIIAFRNRLETGKGLVMEEEKDVTLDDVNRLQRLSELLKGTISEEESRRLVENIETFLIKLKSEEHRLGQIIQNIDNHLSVLKSEVPFLFQKSILSIN